MGGSVRGAGGACVLDPRPVIGDCFDSGFETRAEAGGWSQAAAAFTVVTAVLFMLSFFDLIFICL